jgi:replicative DNA helicase
MAKSVIENVRKGKVVYLSGLEMPAETYDWRIRCMAADVPFWKYLHGKLEDKDMANIKQASSDLKDQGLYFIEKQETGKRSAKYIFQRAIDYEADLLYVDQLQYLENSNGHALGALNDTKDFFQVCNQLRDLSDEIPIWVNHQFNRTIQSQDSFPVMQQIKNSAAVEETGTLVLAMHSTREMRDNNVVQMGAVASRNYGLPIWEIATDMRKGCSLELIDRVDLST